MIIKRNDEVTLLIQQQDTWRDLESARDYYSRTYEQT